MKQIKLTIPFMRISINRAYAGYKIRHKSNKYKEFSKKIELFFIKHGVKYEIIGNKFLKVKYIFYFKIFNKDGSIKIKDVANYEKCLTDELCNNIKGFEDHKIKTITIKKEDSENEYMEIFIKEI